MKKLKIYIASALLVLAAVAVQAQNTPVSQMEKLDRGLVALPNSSGSGNFVSWRYLGTDDPVRTTFNLKRNGIVIKEKLVVTNYKDTGGNNSSQYSVETVVDGKVVETSAPVKAWDKVWLKLPLNRPAGGSTESGAYTYSPNDCSVGDVDGDGKYELFVKWDPSNSKDNSQDGYTGNVIIDCYKLDGTLLWRIDLGRNIRAGAHYTQFMVYDFDGDGKAEMMCKTAPGSKDAAGNYVNQATDNTTIKNASNTKVWLSSSGRMDGGHEYLTVFNGETGAAIHTIAYNPNRNTKSELSEAQGTFNWAVGKTDTHGYNRGDRYLAAVAYLDGSDGNASGIFCRGYYTYAYIWAVDFDGEKLIPRWLHRSDANNQYSVVTYDKQGTGTTKNYTPSAATSGSGSRTMFGNGNHNLSVGDVDGDGCDEIIWGSAGLDNDGKLLYATGFGHGDAIHMGKMIPGRDGMQVFEVHEEKGTYAWDLHDAATGEVLHKGGPEGVDNGRGMAAQLTNKSAEWWFSSNSAREQRSAVTGETASEKSGSLNFRVYWDGTVQDALLDGNKIDKYNSSSNSFSRLVTFSDLGGPSSTCNSTKNTPNLSADILGDWREEVLLYTVTDEETYLGIYTTNIATDYRIPTLMHDHTYRMGICWQNTAYNQPPHIGYNLVEATVTHLIVDKEMNAEVNEPVEFLIAGDFVNSISVVRGIAPDGSSRRSCPVGFSQQTDAETHIINVTGTPTQVGDYKFAVKLTGIGSEVVNDTIVLHVAGPTGIVAAPVKTTYKTEIYDISGCKLPVTDENSLPQGIYVIKRETPDGVEVRKVVK
ncbi:MAG: rhamnogalacturonan lyase [Prevotella sp.]|nr:rhamnogalacturonan lyase [Prevotella sp.]